MKTAKETRQIAENCGMNNAEKLLADLSLMIEIKAGLGLFQYTELVDLHHTLKDVDWVISELVNKGYKVEVEESVAFLVALKISW